jgi:hypothetical protein
MPFVTARSSASQVEAKLHRRCVHRCRAVAANASRRASIIASVNRCRASAACRSARMVSKRINGGKIAGFPVCPVGFTDPEVSALLLLTKGTGLPKTEGRDGFTADCAWHVYFRSGEGAM